MNHKFKNRTTAAISLAAQLKSLNIVNGVVIALPRGGLPLGFEIARALKLPLDIYLSKKIGYPGQPEFAIGSVTLDEVFLNGPAAAVDPGYIQRQVEKIRRKIREQYRKYRGKEQPVSLKDKTVIVVDDGVATGNTIFAAIKAIRKKNPAKIIVAVPVAPPRVIEKLGQMADELICLYTPGNFYGVGQFYENFDPVEDEQVIDYLEKAGYEMDKSG